ncbi:MAG: hypothetical protein AAGF44_01950 [Pseudomonadota bacterium]
MRRRRHRRPLQPTAGLVVYLAAAAGAGRLVTYGELARECGGAARGQGARLTALALRCRAIGAPLLPVLVINAANRLPNLRAEVYLSQGLTTRGAILAEQARCFEHRWAADLPRLTALQSSGPDAVQIGTV